jgi:hypothetical protein
MKNLYTLKFKKKLGNTLLEKLLFLLSLRYAIACHAITVTNYRFTWCNVVINVMFNPVKPLLIISERPVKNKQCGKRHTVKLFFSNYLGQIV